MKKLLIVSALSVICVAAYADNSMVPKALGLSSSCVSEIMKQTTDQCNKDSKDNHDRGRGCAGSVGNSNIIDDNANIAIFDMTFSVGSSEQYTYVVNISDKSTCSFTFEIDNG